MTKRILFTITTISHFMWYYNSLTKFFFQLRGTFAIKLSPLYILKYSFLFNLSETFVNPLKHFFSSKIPYLLIMKQYFFSELKREHTTSLHLCNRFFLVIDSFQLVQLCLIYPNVCFQCTKESESV